MVFTQELSVFIFTITDWLNYALWNGGIMALWNFLCWCLLCFVIFVNSVQYGNVLSHKLGRTVIITPQGKIRGLEIEFRYSMDLGKVEAFRGIEYHLTSPGLRFLPPIGSYKIWDGISKAVDYWSPCSQSFSHPLTRRYLPEFIRERLDTIYTRFLKSLREDCLSLNVYVPMRGKSKL